MQTNKRSAFTLVELMFLIICGAIIVTVVRACTSNAWYVEKSVERELKYQHPEVSRVVHFERRFVFTKSLVVADTTNGSRKNFLLDSSILFDYSLKPTH